MSDAIDSRRAQIQRISDNGKEVHAQIHPAGIGIVPANLTEVIMGAQSVKIDKVMEQLAERLAAVEARADYTEDITITPEAIVIRRRMSMVKDRKY